MAIQSLAKQFKYGSANPIDIKTVVDSVSDFDALKAYEGLVFYDKSAQKVKVVKSVGADGVPQCEEIGGSSELKPATASALGGVKIGNNISVSNGTISVPTASHTNFGVVQVGDNITIENGKISLTADDVCTAIGGNPATQSMLRTVATNGGLILQDGNVLSIDSSWLTNFVQNLIDQNQIPSTIPVSDVSLQQNILTNNTKTLKEGESFTISATISPNNASDKSLKWSSNDSAVKFVLANGTTVSKTTSESGVSVTIKAITQDSSADITVSANSDENIFKKFKVKVEPESTKEKCSFDVSVFDENGDDITKTYRTMSFTKDSYVIVNVNSKSPSDASMRCESTLNLSVTESLTPSGNESYKLTFTNIGDASIELYAEKEGYTSDVSSLKFNVVSSGNIYYGSFTKENPTINFQYLTDDISSAIDDGSLTPLTPNVYDSLEIAGKFNAYYVILIPEDTSYYPVPLDANGDEVPLDEWTYEYKTTGGGEYIIVQGKDYRIYGIWQSKQGVDWVWRVKKI